MSDFINKYVTSLLQKVGSNFPRLNSNKRQEKFVETIIKHFEVASLRQSLHLLRLRSMTTILILNLWYYILVQSKEMPIKM